MKLLRALRDVRYPKGTLEKGSIVFVTEENRIVQGYFMNEILNGYDCEYVDITALTQENLQRLEEVKGLQRKVESLTEFGNKASAHLRKVREDLSKAWAAHNAEREARILMEATLERAMLDHQPVVLPKEVVEAVKYYESQQFTPASFARIFFTHHERDDNGYTKTLKDYVRGTNGEGDKLLKALVKGYTVELTLPIAYELADMIHEWAEEPPLDDEDADCLALATRIAERTKDFYSK